MKNDCVRKVRRIFRRNFQDITVPNAVVNKLRERRLFLDTPQSKE
jgi:hypothetical protein